MCTSDYTRRRFPSTLYYKFIPPHPLHFVRQDVPSSILENTPLVFLGPLLPPGGYIICMSSLPVLSFGPLGVDLVHTLFLDKLKLLLLHSAQQGAYKQP